MKRVIWYILNALALLSFVCCLGVITLWVRSYWRGDHWATLSVKPLAATSTTPASQDLRSWKVASGAGGLGFVWVRAVGPTVDSAGSKSWAVEYSPVYPQPQAFLEGSIREIGARNLIWLGPWSTLYAQQVYYTRQQGSLTDAQRTRFARIPVDFPYWHARYTELVGVPSPYWKAPQLPRRFTMFHDTFSPTSGQSVWMVIVPMWAVLLAIGLITLLAALPQIRRLAQARRLGKGLCPACGYDLRATPERCPECGTVAEAAKGAAN